VKDAFESGQYAECARLLDSYWLRFLMAYTPRVEAPPAIVRQAPKTEENAASTEKPADPPAQTNTGWRIWPFRR
jgi:hypothetical protein